MVVVASEFGPMTAILYLGSSGRTPTQKCFVTIILSILNVANVLLLYFYYFRVVQCSLVPVLVPAPIKQSKQ